MRLNKITKKELKYNALLTVIIICSLFVMTLQGLNASGLSLSDYKVVDENNSRVVFSKN